MSHVDAHPTTAEPKPLAGIRVVELTHWMAGPLAGGLLADWGADVIRVEPPGGDPMRAIFASIGARGDAPNGAFIAANRGKRSIELEIKLPEHRQVFDELLTRADVFLTNLRPDALKRLGLTPQAVGAKYPKLVYGSVSAYGWGGPDQDRPGYDIAAFFARTGISHEITTQGGAPAALMQGIGDSFTALSAATGILAALLERHTTGRGRCVEASLRALGRWPAARLKAWGATRNRPRRGGLPHAALQLVSDADGHWFFLRVQAKRHLPLLAAIGKAELVNDERMRARSIAKNRGTYSPARRRVRRQPGVLSKKFDEHDVCGPRCRRPPTWSGPAAQRSAPDEVEGDDGGSAVAFSGRADPLTRSGAAGPGGPPRAGEHTRDVLGNRLRRRRHPSSQAAQV
jgi:crotonobetainyl-CoA:carnitine CoA-transferase CaiB-like acyl-CoA transferase